MSQQALWVRGALLLTVAGFISKVLGMIYRVPLQNIAGDEGLYIYQQIYPILSIAIMLSVYSIPGALSHTIIRQQHSHEAVRLPQVRAVFYWLWGLGFLVFVMLWLASGSLAHIMGDPNLQTSIKIAGAMFLIIPLTSLLRGYFQSTGLTEYIALSQVVEQFCRVIGIIVVTVLTVYYWPTSLYQLGVYAAWATIIGTAAASLLLMILYRKKASSINAKLNQPLQKGFIRALFVGIAVYSINYLLHLVLQVVDVMSMVDLLREFGYSFNEAKIAKGIFDRSHSLIQLGLVLGSSLALALIPTINKNRSQQIIAFKWTFLLSLSASVGLAVIVPQLNPLLFKTNEEALAIQLMMGLVFLLSMTVVISVFLQEYGYRIEQLKWVVLMVVLKWGLNVLLIPVLGAIGSSLAYLISATVLLVMLIVKWKAIAQVTLPLKFSLKVMLLVVSMGAIVQILPMIYQPSLEHRGLLIPYVLIQCLIGFIVIIAGTYMAKLFTKQEWMTVIGHRLERRF
ncbi:oligosaccharide flippase family protein [Piscibacillus halophilus]|uniref:oligosaccharide flippase family protein n=1 Tax=Piscibacillus halophilus TaxID=571933 RepID=UPI00158853E2|nr:oligosaccharide flippase family protein [Piscibacillus halophilus]